MGNRPDVMPGDALTYQSYDKPWANVSNAPFRLFKHYVHEGGISTPLVAHWPEGIRKPHTVHDACHVVDILPTILAVTGGSYLGELGGNAIQPAQGQSLLPLLQDQPWTREEPIFFEHEGNCAIRQGAFKLVKQFGGPWELYDMDVDRTELSNLAGKNRPVEDRLIRQYEGWATANGVMDWNIALPRLLQAWKLESAEG